MCVTGWLAGCEQAVPERSGADDTLGPTLAASLSQGNKTLASLCAVLHLARIIVGRPLRHLIPPRLLIPTNASRPSPADYIHIRHSTCLSLMYGMLYNINAFVLFYSIELFLPQPAPI